MHECHDFDDHLVRDLLQSSKEYEEVPRPVHRFIQPQFYSSQVQRCPNTTGGGAPFPGWYAIITKMNKKNLTLPLNSLLCAWGKAS